MENKPVVPPTVTPAAPPQKRKKFRWKLWLFMIFFVPVLFFAAYTWFVLNWSYSSGERAGYVQKFSKKGFIAKTWEGELALISFPGTLPEIFRFTVPSDEVAARINASMGKRVKLHYEQHIGLPSRIFGESEYFVNKIEIVED